MTIIVTEIVARTVLRAVLRGLGARSLRRGRRRGPFRPRAGNRPAATAIMPGEADVSWGGPMRVMQSYHGTRPAISSVSPRW